MKNNLIPLHNNYIGVVTPANSEDIRIEKIAGYHRFGYRDKDDHHIYTNMYFDYPVEIIGTYPEISEEQAKEITGYYALRQTSNGRTYTEMLEYLKDIFESKGVDLKESKIVIIKTEK
jgi:hypothetical protein